MSITFPVEMIKPDSIPKPPPVTRAVEANAAIAVGQGYAGNA
jgi:hypothetical protein